MSLITRSNLPSLLRPGLACVFGDWNTFPALWKDVYKEFKSEKAVEYDMEMRGLGLGQFKADGTPVAMGDFAQGYQTSYRFDYWGIGFQISRAAVLDNLYQSQFPQQAMQLRNSLDTLKNINAMYLFNNAFNTNVPVSDGQPLCSTVHPIATGTLANTFSTGVDFSESAVEEAITLVRSWQNLAGLQIDTKTVKALVPQKLAFQAARVFKSAYRTDTANNDVNAIYTDKYMPGGYIVNQFLTNPKQWFLLTDNENSFKFYLRESLDIDFITDVITDSTTVRAIERYAFFCSNWRGVFGSTGS